MFNKKEEIIINIDKDLLEKIDTQSSLMNMSREKFINDTLQSFIKLIEINKKKGD